MKVFCTHVLAEFFKRSNFYRCPLCRQQWYSMQPAPVVYIGDTDRDTIGPEAVPLPKKKYKRCSWCKDIVADRHWFCEFKRLLDKITIGPAPDKRR